MGKQINYYIDRDTEINFLDYVKELGGKFIFKKDLKNYYSDNPEIFRKENGYLSGYIHKTDFGEINIKTLNNVHNQEFETFSVIDSPVVEFYNSIIDLDEKSISRGRIYIEIKYWESEKLVTKSKELDDFYKKLVKWIKKNVPYQEVEINGKVRKEYISNSILKLVQEGKITKLC